MTKVAVLGSTGSIGKNTLRVVDALGGDFRVTALGAGRSVDTLAGQIRRYGPEVVAVCGPAEADALAALLDADPPAARPEILHGRGLAHKGALVKVLGRGRLTRAVAVRAHAVSRAAEAAIIRCRRGASSQRASRPAASTRRATTSSSSAGNRRRSNPLIVSN